MSLTIAASIQAQANRTGQVVGCAVLLITLALIWGLVKTGKRLRTSEANRKCLLSYVFFTSGWLLHAAIAAFTFQTAQPMLGSIVALVVFAGFGLAGVTLAIMGLSEVRQSPDLLKVGRGTAILTLVLSSAVLVMIIAAAGLGALQGMRQRAKIMAPPGAAAVFEDLGFSIQPPAPWARVDASRDNPAATAAFQRSGPDGLLMVIAERLPAGTPADYESFAQGVRDNLAGASRRLKVVDEANESINGLPGRRLICESDFQGVRRTHLYWLHISPTAVYQLVASADTRDASVILPEARKAFASFTLLQPK